MLTITDKITLKNYSKISYSLNMIKKYYSNVNVNPNCSLTLEGFKEYEQYNKLANRYIIDLSLKDAVRTYLNKNRAGKRKLSTIIRNCLVGNYGELTTAMYYKLPWDDFIKQMEKKIEDDMATPFDLLINNAKIEVKTTHYLFLYDNNDNCIPVDTCPHNGIHPKYYKKSKGGFDFMVICFVWKGRFRVMNELIWNKYYMASFHYGTGDGREGEYYANKAKKYPALKKKIVIPYDHLDPVDTYFSRIKV